MDILLPGGEKKLLRGCFYIWSFSSSSVFLLETTSRFHELP